MIIKKFSSESHFLPAYIVFWGLLLWADSFINFRSVEFVVYENSAPFYQLVSNIFSKTPFINILVAFVLVVIQAFMLNNLFTSKNLLERNSYLPALIYITLMSFHAEMLSLNPVIFANFFLIIALNKIFDVYNEDEVFLEVFNTGLLIGTASMFFFPIFVFYIYLLTALVIYFLINLRGLFASVLGFITPMLYIGVYYYLTDQLADKYELYTSTIKVFQIIKYDISAYLKIFYTFIVIISLLSLKKAFLVYARGKPVRIRKRFTAQAYFIFFALLSFLFVNNFFTVNFGVYALAICPVLAVFFQEIRSRFWKEAFFTVLVLIILLGKLNELNYIHFL